MQKSTCCHSKYCPTPTPLFTYMLVCSLLSPRMPSFGFSLLSTNSSALSSHCLAFNLWPPFSVLLLTGIISKVFSCQCSLSFSLCLSVYLYVSTPHKWCLDYDPLLRCAPHVLYVLHSDIWSREVPGIIISTALAQSRHASRERLDFNDEVVHSDNILDINII